jgi:peptide/nickel transport system substrate-binding protein
MSLSILLRSVFMSRPTFVRAGAAVIAVAAATSLAACGGGGGGGGSQSASDTLTIGLNADAAPGGYDPQLYSAGQFQFFSSMYDALFVTNTKGEVVPSLVEKSENNADNTQLTLTLKDGVTFTDGSKLDSTLVKGNLDRRSEDNDNLLIKGSLGAGGANEITDVAAPDPKTVVITWAKPQARGQNALADEAGAIVGADAVADPTTLETTPDGSGPYTLDEGKTTRASSYTVAKNDKAWNADAFSYKTIVYKVITDRQALANAVVSGQVDVAGALDSTTVDLVKSKQSVVSSGGTIVGFPVLDKTGAVNPAFASKEARLALGHAIDRAAIVKDLHPASRATAQLFPKGSQGFDPALDEEFGYDPAKAKQLLAQAGYPNGFEVQVTVLGQPTEDQIAVQDQWKKVGVTLNFVTATSTDQLFAAVRTDPLAFGPFAVGQQPAGFVAGVVVGGFMNAVKTHDPIIEGALGKALGATGAEQDAALKDLNRALTEQGWYIPVYEDYIYFGYNAKKVSEPGLAGTSGYLVLPSIKAAS